MKLIVVVIRERLFSLQRFLYKPVKTLNASIVYTVGLGVFFRN